MPWVRRFLCLCLSVTACGLFAQNDSKAALSPDPTAIPRGLAIALADATALAQQHPGAQVARVVGDSMVPFFAEGDVVVFRPANVQQLRSGAVVVYRNAWNEVVAHRAIKGSAGGWVVQGYHNRSADSTPVTAENLLGVVYGTFHCHDRTQVPVSKSIAGLWQSAAVVQAAPAR